MNCTIVLGIGAIGLGLLLRAQSADLPAEAVRLPSLLIWIVMGLAVLMIIEEILKIRRLRRPDAVVREEDAPLPPINWPVVSVFGAIAVIYVALIPILGYLMTTPVFIALGIWGSKTRSFAIAATIGVASTVVIWLLFSYMLQLPIPLWPMSN